MHSRPSVLFRLAAAIAAMTTAVAALAESMPSAVVAAARDAPIASAFHRAIGSLPQLSLQLSPPDAAEIVAAKRANATARNSPLQIGIGRAIVDGAATSESLKWERVAGGVLAHWRITSPAAKALRVGLAVQSMERDVRIRYAGTGGGAVYGPFVIADLKAAGTHWSPVLTGETAVIEIFVPEGTALPKLSIAQIAHLFADPSDPRAMAQLKDGSAPCEVDLICRSAADEKLAEAGKAVVLFTFVSNSSGSSYICSGTLLNSNTIARPPYIYSTAACAANASEASSITTYWFFDRIQCGSGTTAPGAVQLPGGATIVHRDAAKDALLLRLEGMPPAGAVYAGWDATTLAEGMLLVGIHHPEGDWKKVSVGKMTRFELLEVNAGSISVGQGESFVRVDWSSGVTENGSTGSGIFSKLGTDYLFRGGLFTGASACSAPPADMYDWYSRFDLVYPAIRQYLNPSGAAEQVVVEYLNTADFPNSPGGHFFYSSDPAEQAAVDAGAAGAFTRTNRQFFTGGTSPVCRFYGSVTPGPNSHFFTVDVNECNALRAAQVMPRPNDVQQWNYEGIGYNTTPAIVSPNGTRSCPPDTQPLYRAYNNAFPPSGPRNPWDSNHRFTPLRSDIAALVAQGWRDEGLVFCTAICANCLGPAQ
jgi:hypothetical protein